MASIIFPRLLSQVNQAVQFALREWPGNDNRPGRTVRANAHALEIGELLGEQAGKSEYAVTRVALENGLPNSRWRHGQ
jgi:hypothetical protein